MVYKEKIKISKEEYDFYSKLLSFDLETMCEEDLEKEKARKDDFISIMKPISNYTSNVLTILFSKLTNKTNVGG